MCLFMVLEKREKIAILEVKMDDSGFVVSWFENGGTVILADDRTKISQGEACSKKNMTLEQFEERLKAFCDRAEQRASPLPAREEGLAQTERAHN